MSNEELVRGFAFGNLYAKKESGIFVDANWGDLPPVVPFKRLMGAPIIPLPESLPALGSLGEAFAGLVEPVRQVEAPRLEKLAALLSYNLGLLRREVMHRYNNHRAVPSPRCLYPSELYVWLPGGADLDEGLYHYLPTEHALELVRPGGRAWLEASLGVGLDGVEVVALLGLEFWRVCYRYGDFGYRLCNLEAGHLAGNLLLVGSALGWQGQVRYQFVDGWLHEALGLPESEEACAGAVLFGRRLPASLDRAEVRSRPQHSEPLRGQWHASAGTRFTAQTARLREAARASNLEGLGEIRRPVAAAGMVSPPSVSGLEQLNARPLEDALYERNAGIGPNGLAPDPVPLSGPLVSQAMAAALSPYRHDSGALPYVRPYMDIHAVALRVEGLEPGVHRYQPETGKLELFRRGLDTLALQKTYLVPDTVNVAAHGLVWFLSTDVHAAFSRWGARGYRILLMEAGLVMQWLSVSMSAPKLLARASLSYSERPVERMLGLAGTTSSVVYQLLVGTTRCHGYRLDLRPWS
jgi:SagB-type dehydrogenase family enzyme